MAVFKCKMCGGDLNLDLVQDNVVECEYCSTKQTIPSTDNEKLTNLYNRANRLRFSNEFDKAAGVFESIAAEFPEEAEAYWGLCLCKYGIEYVDDPATGKKIPTCHRTAFESIFEDSNFELAQEYADVVAKRLYREEAKEIDRIQKGILEIANKEEPFDIFICYKETAHDGQRTKDSVLAQEMYDALTAKGYKVFFARITLEDKLGQEYEPYIFSALNSAKVMLAVGTDYEYFNAVWVKNEWSRFLDMKKKDSSKVLIPCYADIDAYDMPTEFRNLQAQDMGKVGFIQDLVCGIGKIIPLDNGASYAAPVQTVVQQVSSNANNLLKRGFMALEESDWGSANKFFERVLDENAEYGEAYLGLLMVELKVNTKENIKNSRLPFDGSSNYKKAIRFGSDDLKQELESYRSYVGDRIKAGHTQDVISEYGAVLSNGTVVVYGKPTEYSQSSVSMWRNIVAISSTMRYMLGLKSNGTVVSTGKNGFGQCNVSLWRDIVAISARDLHSLGLKSDGTVVAVGDNGEGQCNVSKWRDIVAISAGGSHSLGLKSDGTVKAVGDNDEGQRNVSGWRDIVAISAGVNHSLGLKSDGTVVAVGGNDKGQCNVSEWRDIVAISAGGWHSLGLKSDGTVVATGSNHDGECNVSGWRDIVAIGATIKSNGLKSDGTVVSTGFKFRSSVINVIAFSSRHALKSYGTVVDMNNQIVCTGVRTTPRRLI